MYPLDISRTVKLIIDTCLNVQPDQRILIAGFTEDDLKLAAALAARAHAAGAEVGIILVAPPAAKVEPPSFLAAAMKAVDLVITLGSVDFGHTAARKAITSQGISYAYIPDLMNQEMINLDVQPQDLLDVMEQTLVIAERVSNARTARITSPSGTDIEIDITARQGLPLHPIFRTPGHFAIVPFYYEVACAPVENRASGTVVADGTIVGLPALNGVLDEPITWEMEKGRVTNIRGGKKARLLAQLLPSLGENANSLGELGIGTNDKMHNLLVGNRRDNAILGHIHLALGRNVDLGGNQWSPIHADFMVMDAALELDGRPIIGQGLFLG
jgi:leucyl aminopeptidase (aminopeptidase T)